MTLACGESKKDLPESHQPAAPEKADTLELTLTGMLLVLHPFVGHTGWCKFQVISAPQGDRTG